MKKFFMLLLIVLFMPTTNAMAGEGALLKTLLKKGIITESEYQEALKKEGESLAVPDWMERVTLTGTIEGDFTWTEHGDVADKNSDPTSDLIIGTVELGTEVAFTDWLNGFVLFKAENLGKDDETDVTVDEATMTMQKEDAPLYLVFGKRAQPFGVYENHLITDPMTQDAYETSRAGITIGYTGPMDLDLSATIYKGEEQMDHLADAGLFDITRAGDAGDDVNSYILSASVLLMENLTFFGGYLSEPGRGERNNTANVGITFDFADIMIEAEYMKALQREKYDGISDEYKEGVFSISASYALLLSEREQAGGALFAHRKSHVVSEPLEFAVRYESFDDDDFADKESAWSVDNRYSVGVRYSFYADEDSDLAAFVAGEYRYTDYKVHSGLTARADSNSEFNAKMGVNF